MWPMFPTLTIFKCHLFFRLWIIFLNPFFFQQWHIFSSVSLFFQLDPFFQLLHILLGVTRSPWLGLCGFRCYPRVISKVPHLCFLPRASLFSVNLYWKCFLVVLNRVSKIGTLKQGRKISDFCLKHGHTSPGLTASSYELSDTMQKITQMKRFVSLFISSLLCIMAETSTVIVYRYPRSSTAGLPSQWR